jgi:hypothetical protein
MKKILIQFPDRSKHAYTFGELGLDENATDEEITEVVDEEVFQQISWGHEVIEE